MPDEANLLKSPFDAAHRAGGARLVDFAGWAMPLLYAGILEEHHACRTSAAIFDVSHMGRLRIKGGKAFKLLAAACTADVATQEDDTARYSLLCNEAGGVLDDLFLLRFEDSWLVVCNAANREKVLAQLANVNQAGGFGAKIKDETLDTAMVAVQGPEAVERLADVLPIDVASAGRRGVIRGSHMMIPFTASRSGYTGEDGFEIILPRNIAGMAWKYITGGDGGMTPAGLGSRDVLRLEAALPLYGHELNETIDPISAGLGFACRKTGGYVGAEAIEKIRAAGPVRKLVCIKLQGRRIARQGCAIALDGVEVGAVTSGTFSPSCDASIAMGYVDRSRAEVGAAVTVAVRPDESAEGEIVARPFYKGSAFKQ